jgi:hypothetical protein
MFFTIIFTKKIIILSAVIEQKMLEGGKSNGLAEQIVVKGITALIRLLVNLKLHMKLSICVTAHTNSGRAGGKEST